MDYFQNMQGEVYCEDIPLSQLARDYGTPAYIYSRTTLRRHLQRLKEAFASYPTLPCFAVKANSNLTILREIFSAGFGADLVSGGELQRSLKAGVDPQKIVFSGVGKTESEIQAALESGLLAFNVESAFELERINQVARSLNIEAPICFRVNPNIDAKTNPKIATGLFSTKFGIVEEELRRLVQEAEALSHIRLVGIACHIGSQITDITPLGEAAEKVSSIAQELLDAGHPLKFINMGGGLGIRYKNEPQPNLEEYAQMLIQHVSRTGLQLIIEPGRVLVGNIGILLTRVLGIKTTPQKVFAIVDGAMNDVIRPTLYDSFHEIVPVKDQVGKPVQDYDIVGPICETGDFFAKDRQLPQLDAGDLIYLRGCGAYTASMASNYNSRPRAPEILVEKNQAYIIKPRETVEDLWRGEGLSLPEVD